MNASIIDLRYKTRSILTALENRESITILYHGKPKGTIVPLPGKKRLRVSEHEFFAMYAGKAKPVAAVMKEIRERRNAL
jgi:antitoxin (DNA-binding transcriptional repressor) of toxin-antitoxin stability system